MRPPSIRAEAWFATGEYSWNAGIFVWRAGVFLDALAASRPALAAPWRGLGRLDVRSFADALERLLPGMEAISVDYAVLEHAPNVLVIEASFDWDDLGSWNAWARHQPRDGQGNVVLGNVAAIDCEGCIIVSEAAAPVAVLGLRDQIVVQSDAGTLVCRRDADNQVRRVVETLKERASR